MIDLISVAPDVYLAHLQFEREVSLQHARLRRLALSHYRPQRESRLPQLLLAVRLLAPGATEKRPLRPGTAPQHEIDPWRGRSRA